MKIYLVGSLKNPNVPLLGNALRDLGFDVFDDWWGAGPEADDCWQGYETIRGREYKDALHGHAATNIFTFDLGHLATSDAAVLLLPAGRSAHMEFGYIVGLRKPSFVLFDAIPERWDLMYRLANGVFFKQEDLLEALKRWTG